MSNTTTSTQTSTTTRVMVYRNITKGCWSIKDTKTNRVIGHADSLWLSNCGFKVSEAGRQRVIRERKKYVHAGITGMITLKWNTIDKWTKVRYNPYTCSTFVDPEMKPVYHADVVYLDHFGNVHMAA